MFKQREFPQQVRFLISRVCFPTNENVDFKRGSTEGMETDTKAQTSLMRELARPRDRGTGRFCAATNRYRTHANSWQAERRAAGKAHAKRAERPPERHRGIRRRGQDVSIPHRYHARFRNLLTGYTGLRPYL